MAILTIGDKSKEFDLGANLHLAILDMGVYLDNPCNGKGTCGKCKIKLLKGELNPLSKDEERLLKSTEIEEGVRLACMCKIQGDLEIEVLRKEKKVEVLSSGFMPDFTMEKRSGYGIAMDIGTTTVVLEIVDLTSGQILSKASMVNAQKHYGLDVLTRITYEVEKGQEAIDALQKAIVKSINSMIIEACDKAGIKKEELVEIDIAANTTMGHMLHGIDARSLGKFPYKPEFTEAKLVKASSIGIEAGEDTMVYTLPHVSAFIGSDIVAGAYVTEMEAFKGNVLFIDIGTNGEIVLAKEGRLLCCSCAAGPALEGMNISCGMRAEVGAVEDVKIRETGVELITIGNEAPIGLCGSGILAVIKELLKSGIVLDTGAFIKKEKLDPSDYRYDLIRLDGKKREFLMNKDPELIVTQSDVRQVQLAKGAILSGFIALLNRAGITMSDLSKVYVAGQFGAHLPAESLVGTGILPLEVEKKIDYVGNTSKTGAYMTLMSAKVKAEMEELAKEMEYVELAVTENYEMIFRESLNFPKFN